MPCLNQWFPFSEQVAVRMDCIGTPPLADQQRCSQRDYPVMQHLGITLEWYLSGTTCMSEDYVSKPVSDWLCQLHSAWDITPLSRWHQFWDFKDPYSMRLLVTAVVKVPIRCTFALICCIARVAICDVL
jgi:hypothetical protein